MDSSRANAAETSEQYVLDGKSLEKQEVSEKHRGFEVAVYPIVQALEPQATPVDRPVEQAGAQHVEHGTQCQGGDDDDKQT